MKSNNRGRPPKIRIDIDQPKWLCYKCGIKYGSFKCGLATWHQDTCGVCGKGNVACTEPRDFGYLLEGWKEKLAIDKQNDEEINKKKRNKRQ